VLPAVFITIMKDRPTDTLLELKKEIADGTLKDIPFVHPKSKHAPDEKCDTCLGTGWKLIYKHKFTVLEGKYSYKDCFGFFCACTWFSQEDTKLVNEMFSSLNGR
jgi:hypothetical protein